MPKRFRRLGRLKFRRVDRQLGSDRGRPVQRVIAPYGFVGGGQANTVRSGWALSRGYGNQAGEIATIPGGKNNLATGEGSFAAGVGSTASYAGDFV